LRHLPVDFYKIPTHLENGWTDSQLQLDEATIKLVNEKADAKYYGDKEKPESPHIATLREFFGNVSL